MKPFNSLLLILLFFSSAQVSAQSDDDILAQRGNGVVTQKNFTARVNKIPADKRRPVLRDGKRLSDVIMSMLMRAQLAADARAAGFDKNDIVQERMRLAADSELGDAWLQHYVDTQPAADYEALARETYQLNEDKYLTAEKIDVSHILISNKDRSDAEAKVLADSISVQLEAKPALFDEFVLEYSEDPSAASNQGHFFAVKQGDMVTAFEEAAFALQNGEISLPVQTQYGFHIIRLDKQIPATKATFAEVKTQLIASERSKHDDRVRQDYISGLNSQDAILTKEALEELVRRLFDEDASD